MLENSPRIRATPITTIRATKKLSPKKPHNRFVVRFLVLPTVALLSVLCLSAARPCRAQFLTPRSFLGGTHPLDLPQAKLLSGANPLSLFAAPGKNTLDTQAAQNRVFVTAAAGQSVQTVRGGVHTGDLWGTGQSVFLTLSRPQNGLRGDFFYQAGRQSGLSAQPDQNRRTNAHAQTGEWAVRIVSGGASWGGFAGVGQTRADLQSESTAYFHLLPLFGDTMPTLRGQIRLRETTAGATYSAPHFFVWAAAGWVDAPGNLRLDGSTNAGETAQVRLPLQSGGPLWSMGGQTTFARGAGTVAAFFTRKTTRGTGNVTRLGASQTELGTGETHQDESSGGIAAAYQMRPSSTFTVFYDKAGGSFNTAGGGLLAQTLGFSSDTVNRVGYFARARVTRETFGLSWDKDWGKERDALLSLRYVRLPLRADYGYSGRLFLLSYGQGETFDEPSARGFALRGRVGFPLNRQGNRSPRLVVQADQIIPLPLTRRKNAAPNPNPPGVQNGPRTQTRGGWGVSAGIAYPF